MKKIVFLGHNNKEPNGDRIVDGVERVMYNQKIILEERGFEVLYYQLFTKEQYKGLNHYLKENDVDVAVLHMYTPKIKKWLNLPCPLICEWHSTPGYVQDLTQFCEKNHIKDWLYNILKCPLFHWLFLNVHKIHKVFLFTRATAMSDKMVLLSEKFKPIFFPAKLFPSKVIAISNFIDKSMLNVNVDLDEKKKEILYVGRLENKTKRIDLLLQIWSKIERDINDWRLNICGSGPDEVMLKQMKQDLGLKNVFFFGYVKPEEYYKTASVFCMTSAIEGFGLVLAEAASYGCALMAFDSYEAASDLITDYENGRLIQPFDVDAYSNALKELIENKELRVRLAMNAKRDVKRFDPEKIMDEWENLFEEVGNKKKHERKNLN